MNYIQTEEDCQKKCEGRVCRRCGSSLSPIETVDNARHPTFWMGCLDCGIFTDGTTPKVYERAASLKESFNDISMDDLCFITYLLTADDRAVEEELAEANKDKEYLLSIVKLAYRKHHLNDDSIGWSEFDDNLLDALCNIMGEDGYNKWIKEITRSEK